MAGWSYRVCCTYIIRSVDVVDGVHVGELGFVYVVNIGDKAVRCFSFYSEKPIVRSEKQTLPVVVLQPQAMSLCVRKVPFMGWASVAKPA